ncbi:MAG: hypothetical protein KGM16_01245 [Bacteroidota bacterium]|nr:hypothetical protein [Bacteroidota bacterium]
MKKAILLILTATTIFVSQSFGQIKIDRFCQVELGLRKHAIISVGLEDSLFLFKDSSIITRLKMVNKLTTSTDVLNYMSNLGWTIISIIPFGLNTLQEKLYFKKSFDKTELMNDN